MITVIKPGDQGKLDPKRRFICRKCACEFTANKSDFKKQIDDDRFPGTVHHYLICPQPECDQSIYWNAHADKDTDLY
jgi:hypothetical protein